MTDEEMRAILGDFDDLPRVFKYRGYYAGVGSRETPQEMIPIITKIVALLEEKGFILRSGGANGADSFFEQAVDNPRMKEIYIPWKGFNNNPSKLYEVTKESIAYSRRFHPTGFRTDAVAKLMGRNANQVLGADLKTPSDFIIAWTKDGKATGGTGQAIRIANHHNIPVYNLYNKADLERLGRFLNSL